MIDHFYLLKKKILRKNKMIFPIQTKFCLIPKPHKWVCEKKKGKTKRERVRSRWTALMFHSTKLSCVGSPLCSRHTAKYRTYELYSVKTEWVIYKWRWSKVQINSITIYFQIKIKKTELSKCRVQLSRCFCHKRASWDPLAILQFFRGKSVN